MQNYVGRTALMFAAELADDSMIEYVLLSKSDTGPGAHTLHLTLFLLMEGDCDLSSVLWHVVGRSIDILRALLAAPRLDLHVESEKRSSVDHRPKTVRSVGVLVKSSAFWHAANACSILLHNGSLAFGIEL